MEISIDDNRGLLVVALTSAASSDRRPFGAESWPLKEKHNTKLSVAEMRMLRWMSGFTLRDTIRNEHIREKVGVAPVEDKIRESRLRWFGHIKWRPSNDPINTPPLLHLYHLPRSKSLLLANKWKSGKQLRKWSRRRILLSPLIAPFISKSVEGYRGR
ncbi:hypothetical protein KFK09_028565 [Dendrobium nobile]|uniref:Ataxia telangiectasia mutated family protein n=1 Tax=Dendrobium nobile TaxID=94219 RepID=A0A8T3A2Z5_DENNO|nr:hypothetical protein KFK09_028565 [Dendrobium nobile]